MMMKLIFLLLLSGLGAQAEVPKLRPLTEYYHLWQNSPFTVKPVVEKTEAVVLNDLEDYVLIGVEVTPQGNLVVVQNVKEQGQRMTITSWDEGRSGFKILEIQQNPSDVMLTRVLLEKGSNKGWVGYDPQYLTLKSAPAATKKDDQQNNRGRNDRGNSRNNQQQQQKAEPRVRFVKPENK